MDYNSAIQLVRSLASAWGFDVTHCRVRAFTLHQPEHLCGWAAAPLDFPDIAIRFRLWLLPLALGMDL